MRKWWMVSLILSGIVLLQNVSPSVLQADSGAEIPVETAYIALTFDDGPGRETTARLLDGLNIRGASATFFLVGEQVVRYPDLVKRMKAEGHQVGNHTWSHMRLENEEADEVLWEVWQNELLLEEILGGRGYWLRPPYGLIDPEVADKLLIPMVKWSVDPRDWESRNANKIVEAVLDDVRPGSIILLHDIYDSSVDAALRLVDELQAQGYWFVTVEELLRLNGITPQAGVLYRSAE